MNIHYITPYNVDKNIGKAYNEACAVVPDGDWICLRDGDTMFLNPEWGRHVERIVHTAIIDGISLVGCMTNRLATGSPQLVQGTYDNHDMKFHNGVAVTQYAIYGCQILKVQHILAGHFLLFPKSTWGRTKFEENTIHFDSRFSNDVNSWGRLGLAMGLYIYHWYRGNSQYRQPQYDNEHLMK